MLDVNKLEKLTEEMDTIVLQYQAGGKIPFEVPSDFRFRYPEYLAE